MNFHECNIHGRCLFCGSCVLYGWDPAKTSLTTKANMVSYTSELYLDIC